MYETTTPLADGSAYISVAQLMALQPLARGLGLSARQPSRSVLAGRHTSRLRGRGVSFDQLRRYQPGDDLRYLDWRASMRYGKPYVRTFTEERDRPVLILVDQRMSMFFGSRRVLKSVCAAELGALVAWIVTNAGDRVGGIVFNDQRIERLRPKRSRKGVELICSSISKYNQALCATNPDEGGEAKLDEALRNCLELVGHDYMLCVISDFAGATSRTGDLLQKLSAHNDVIAMHVYDSLALQLPKRGRVRITQGEYQVMLEMDRRAVHHPLSGFLEGRLREITDLLQQCQVPVMQFNTQDRVAAQLSRQLGRLVRPR